MEKNNVTNFSQLNPITIGFNSKILILKTNVKTEKDVKEFSQELEYLPSSTTWSVDTQDIDCVLRIVVTSNVSEYDIVELLISRGFYCEILES